MTDKKKKTDNRRRCPSCKARKVPTKVDALEMCGACGLVLPIVEKQGKPLIEVLSEEERASINRSKAMAEAFGWDSSTEPPEECTLPKVKVEVAPEKEGGEQWENLCDPIPQPETTGESKAPPFVDDSDPQKALAEVMREEPSYPVETQPAAESRTRKRVARLDCVPMGTHFRTGNGYVGILMDVNESFARVNSVRIGERKREIQTWSPATEVQVISEQEFRDLARSGTDEADTMSEGNTTQVEGENMAKTEAKAALKVPAETAAAILIALGVKTVTAKTPIAQLGTKLKSLISKAEDKDALQVDDDNQQKVLTTIVEAVVSKQGIEILPAATVAKEDKGTSKKPNKPAKKGGKDKGDAKAETNGHAPKGNKPHDRKKVGVCQTIEECLTNASKTNPVTTVEILEVLIEKFPDRSKDSMKSSVNTHVSQLVKGRFTESRGKTAFKSDKGYWMKVSKKAKASAE